MLDRVALAVVAASRNSADSATATTAFVEQFGEP
jgi:hypothetical protein